MKWNDYKGMERNEMEWNVYKKGKGMEKNGMELSNLDLMF